MSMKHLWWGAFLDVASIITTGSERPASSHVILTNEYKPWIPPAAFLTEGSNCTRTLDALMLLLNSKSLWQRQGSGPQANLFSKVTVSHELSNTLCYVSIKYQWVETYFATFIFSIFELAKGFSQLNSTNTATHTDTPLKYMRIIDNLYLRESVHLNPWEMAPMDLNHIPSRDRTSESIRGNVRAGGRQAASSRL